MDNNHKPRHRHRHHHRDRIPTSHSDATISCSTHSRKQSARIDDNSIGITPVQFIQVKPKVNNDQIFKRINKSEDRTGPEETSSLVRAEKFLAKGACGDGIDLVKASVFAQEKQRIPQEKEIPLKSYDRFSRNWDPDSTSSEDEEEGYDSEDGSEPFATSEGCTLISKSGIIKGETVISKSVESIVSNHASSKVGPKPPGEPESEDSARLDYTPKNLDNLFEMFKVEEPKVGIFHIDEESYTKFYKIGNKNSGTRRLLNQQGILENLSEFVKHPVYPGFYLKCTVTRNRRGFGLSVYPTYYLKLETENGKIALLAARKRKKAKTSCYLISTDYAELNRDSEAYIGKVRSNLMGTQFTIYDSGMSPKKFGLEGTLSMDFREELGVVIYERNILGLRGPRKMKVILPGMINKCQRYPHVPDSGEDKGLEAKPVYTTVEVRNKTPSWNTHCNSFVLNFFGRVTEASVKNFQIIKEGHEEEVCMQFGRIGADAFTLDIGFPFCPLQAFGIALSSLDSKIACE